MSTLNSLHRSQRLGSGLESALRRLLGAGAILLAVGYGSCLVYLLVRGGAKVFSFTSYATPLVGVENEEVMRFVVALALFGGLGYGAMSVVRAVGSRVHLWTARLEKGSRLVVLAGAVAMAAFGRDHLPRFLIALPSETSAGGGIAPELFNTVYFAVLSTMITLPIGVGAAVYLARFAHSRRFVGTVRTALDTLAALPSIVYGLFGFLVFVVEMRAGYSLFAGAFVLALLNLPLVVGIAEESLRAVPLELDDASLALGATPVQTTLRVTIPYAWPGVLSALVLSVGRVFAESAPLIMTAGTTISRSNAFSLDPFRGGETLAVHLWYVNSAGLSPDKAEVSAGTAAVLVVLVTVTNVLASRFARFGGAEGARVKRATR
ncbi:MAG: phosphate ABC transporter permease PstA [Myxococcota bacterium]|nr:phosphate ABC transporter permease PstA [Myxococcota bacterium]